MQRSTEVLRRWWIETITDERIAEKDPETICREYLEMYERLIGGDDSSGLIDSNEIDPNTGREPEEV